MNQSTIIMPCNNSGYMDPKRTIGWSIIDFDWSNGKAIWTKQRPMLDEVVLQNQVEMSTKASLGTTVWVYRGSMWAYPWYVRGGRGVYHRVRCTLWTYPPYPLVPVDLLCVGACVCSFHGLPGCVR